MTEFYSRQKMYINEVLYHIDEDYKKWCDTIDMVCEELLLEQKDDWFFNMTPDEQDKYLKDHPNSEKATKSSMGSVPATRPAICLPPVSAAMKPSNTNPAALSL